MSGFLNLMRYGLSRRLKDFFIIVYNVVAPMLFVLLLGYLATNFFKGDASINSNEYYTITMLPFYILTSIITVAYVAKDENFHKTSYRFIIAPVDNSSIVLSKIFSCTIVILFCNLLNLLIAKLLLGVDFGRGTLTIILMFLVEGFGASALGILLGICIRNFSTIKGIINIPISILGLLGGVFFPAGSLGATFEKVSYISPFTWINKGIISAIYDGNYKILMYSIVVSLLLGIIFSVLSVALFKKEAFL